MWGIIPAAGMGARIQPIPFSKELLPVGVDRPRPVSEYLVERMILAGATKLCFVISPAKTDILKYYGGERFGVDIVYAVQPKPAGLCDALFRAAPLVAPEESVLIGLPDTIWYPLDGFTRLPENALSFLLFPVAKPQQFDAVVTDNSGSVREIQVKDASPATHWVWGALKCPGHVFQYLSSLWIKRGKCDEYLGTLVNAYLQAGGKAVGVRAGTTYVDAGTVEGYREANRLLSEGEADQSVLRYA